MLKFTIPLIVGVALLFVFDLFEFELHPLELRAVSSNSSRNQLHSNGTATEYPSGLVYDDPTPLNVNVLAFRPTVDKEQLDRHFEVYGPVLNGDLVVNTEYIVFIERHDTFLVPLNMNTNGQRKGGDSFYVRVLGNVRLAFEVQYCDPYTLIGLEYGCSVGEIYFARVKVPKDGSYVLEVFLINEYFKSHDGYKCKADPALCFRLEERTKHPDGENSREYSELLETIYAKPVEVHPTKEPLADSALTLSKLCNTTYSSGYWIRAKTILPEIEKNIESYNKEQAQDILDYYNIEKYPQKFAPQYENDPMCTEDDFVWHNPACLYRLPSIINRRQCFKDKHVLFSGDSHGRYQAYDFLIELSDELVTLPPKLWGTSEVTIGDNTQVTFLGFARFSQQDELISYLKGSVLDFAVLHGLGAAHTICFESLQEYKNKFPGLLKLVMDSFQNTATRVVFVITGDWSAFGTRTMNVMQEVVKLQRDEIRKYQATNNYLTVIDFWAETFPYNEHKSGCVVHPEDPTHYEAPFAPGVYGYVGGNVPFTMYGKLSWSLCYQILNAFCN